MNRLAPLRVALSAFALALSLCGAAQSQSQSPMLPPVAAEFQLDIDAQGIALAPSQRWRMWRDTQRLIRDDVTHQTSEVWQRDGQTLIHTKYFHGARRGVEFQQADLAMLNALPSWSQLVSVIAPELISALPQTAAGSTDGHPWQRHQGVIQEVTWDITWRPDLMLPVSVDRTDRKQHEHLTLRSVTALIDAPWQPMSTEGYDVLDFADLGDHERDPFVVELQQHLELAQPPGHVH